MVFMLLLFMGVLYGYITIKELKDENKRLNVEVLIATDTGTSKNKKKGKKEINDDKQ